LAATGSTTGAVLLGLGNSGCGSNAEGSPGEALWRIFEILSVLKEIERCQE